MKACLHQLARFACPLCLLIAPAQDKDQRLSPLNRRADQAESAGRKVSGFQATRYSCLKGNFGSVDGCRSR
jgi:hypothetical protein